MIYLLMSRGQFPQSVKLSERAVAWDSEEIDKWISERAKQSRTA